MIPVRSHRSSSSCLSRVLIAGNCSATKSVIRTFGDRRLNTDVHVSTSHNHAVMNLFHSPPQYQLVICCVQLAEMHEFLLLKHNRMLQPFVPFVITATTAEQARAHRALEQGAFDLISDPVEHEQMVSTIRLALWHSKLRNLIARKETVQDKCRQHMANYPDEREMEETFKRALAVMEEASSSVGRTILPSEERTVRFFDDFATKVEHYARKRALERLVRTSHEHQMNELGSAGVNV